MVLNVFIFIHALEMFLKSFNKTILRAPGKSTPAGIRITRQSQKVAAHP